MSKSFEISSSTGNYSVTIGAGILAKSLTDSHDAMLLCDTMFLDRLNDQPYPTIGFQASEEQKTLTGVAEIIAGMREAGASRSTMLWAIGGGVIQDVATLSAALYMRGLTWRYVPTTLLAMVDSCIGGKSAINVGHYKNLVGNFYPPSGIVIDTDFVSTLDQSQQAAGLCEAAKICFARGDTQFQRFLFLADPEGEQTRDWAAIIQESLLCKKWFVETDEFDQNERLLLNFGHTFGHAIEGASEYRVPHGLAVGLGILAADALAKFLGNYQQSPGRVQSLLDYLRHVLSKCALDDTLHGISAENALRCFESDKKHRRDTYAVILPDASGMLTRVFLDKSTASRTIIKLAFENSLSFPQK